MLAAVVQMVEVRNAVDTELAVARIAEVVLDMGHYLEVRKAAVAADNLATWKGPKP